MKIQRFLASLSLLDEGFQRCMRPTLLALARVASEVAPKVSALVGTLAPAIRWMETAPTDLRELYRHSGYLPVPELSLEFYARLTRLWDGGNGRTAALSMVDEEYNALFTGHEFWESLIARWQSYEGTPGRSAILCEGLACHFEGLYAVAVPTMLAQAEGIVADISQHVAIMNGKIFRAYVAKISALDPLFGPAITCFVNEELLQNFGHVINLPIGLSRHAVLHGGDVAYANETQSRQAILWVDRPVQAYSEKLSANHHASPGVTSGAEKCQT